MTNPARRTFLRPALCLSALALVSACSGGTKLGQGLPRSFDAYPTPTHAEVVRISPQYRIGPLDTIDVNVFLEPDLSVKGLAVDASGNVMLPLLGSFPAAGKTAAQLGTELAERYERDYLNDPQVSVAVVSSVSQKVVVQGQVTEPGVYPIKGSTTLLEAISMANGETNVAALNQVVVYRTVGGQRMGALFDVNQIRTGQSADPEIFGNDTVIVGYSQGKSIWRDVLSAAPLLNIFRPLGY